MVLDVTDSVLLEESGCRLEEGVYGALSVGYTGSVGLFDIVSGIPQGKRA